MRDEQRGEGKAALSKAETIWNSAFISLIIIALFQSMGQMMINTLIPLYAYDLGAAAQVVGVVTGAFAISALLVRPFAGPAFDAFSKKKILFASLVVIAIAMFLYSISTSIPMIFASRLLHGLGMACAGPIALALAGESLPASKVNFGLSIFSLSFAVSQAAGPAFALWVQGAVGFEWTFRISAASIVVACFLSLLVKEDDPLLREKYQLKLSRIIAKESLLPAGLNVLLVIPFSCINAFVVIYGNLSGVEGMGWFFTVYALCLLATRPVFGRFADKFGVGKTIPLGLLFFAVSLVMIWFSSSLQGFIAAALVGAFGYGAVSPLLQSLSIQCAPLDARGAASNTYYIGLDFGYLLGPVLGGVVVDVLCSCGFAQQQAYGNMYLILLVPTLLAFLIFIFNRTKLNQFVLGNSKDSANK